MAISFNARGQARPPDPSSSDGGSGNSENTVIAGRCITPAGLRHTNRHRQAGRKGRDRGSWPFLHNRPALVIAVVALLASAGSIAAFVPPDRTLARDSRFSAATSECGFFGAPFGPAGAVYDPSTNQVFVADSETNYVYVLSATNFTVVKSISMGASCVNPFDLIYDSSAREVLVTEPGAPAVAAISDYNDSVVATYPVPALPIDEALDTTLNELYVTQVGLGNVSVLSMATGKIVGTISLGRPAQPWGITFDSAQDEMFVADSLGSYVTTLSVISDTTQSLVATVDVSGQGAVGSWPQNPFDVVYDPTTQDVYASFLLSDGLSVVSTLSDSQVQSIALPGGSTELAFDPATNAIWAGGYDPDALYSVPTVYSVYGGLGPIVSNNSTEVSAYEGLAVDPRSGDVFVPDFTTTNISVFDSNATRIATVTLPAAPSPTFGVSGDGILIAIALALGAIVVVAVVASRSLPSRPPAKPGM